MTRTAKPFARDGSRRAPLGRVLARLVAAGVPISLAVAASCADDLTATETFACPSEEVFIESVSPFLERRCGTLDCHGAPTRPARLYGQLGLRHPLESNRTGDLAAPTTDLERADNYAAMCNVEPEAIAKAVEDFGQSAEELVIVRKARGVESHKGGKVVNEQDAGDRCILGWLRGDAPEAVEASCLEARCQIGDTEACAN